MTMKHRSLLALILAFDSVRRYVMLRKLDVIIEENSTKRKEQKRAATFPSSSKLQLGEFGSHKKAEGRV